MEFCKTLMALALAAAFLLAASGCEIKSCCDRYKEQCEQKNVVPMTFVTEVHNYTECPQTPKCAQPDCFNVVREQIAEMDKDVEDLREVLK